jgi:hypothetical protein
VTDREANPLPAGARLGTVKTHFQGGRIACHNMGVSELVLSCQYPEEEQAGDLKKYY